MRNLNFVMACFLTFITYVGIFMRIPIIPLYAKSIGASTMEVGLIAFSFMIIASSLAIPLGSLSDNLGRRRLISIGVILTAAASFLLPLTNTPLQIMIIYGLAGLGASSFAPAMASFVGDITSMQRMGRSYGWYTASMQLGMASGPSIGGFIAGYAGYKAVFLFSGLIALLGLIVVTRLPKLSVQSSVYNLHQISRGILELSKNSKIIAAWLATFFVAFAFGVFQPFFPLYAKDIGITEFFIGIIFGVNAVFSAFGRIPAGYLSDKIGRRYPFILAGMIIFAFCISIIGLLETIYPILVTVGIAGLAMGVTTMAVTTSLAVTAEKENRGIALGGFSTSLYGGFALSGIIGGKIISSYGFTTGFATAGIVCGVGAVIFYIIRYLT